jgi:hypothetical protein
MAQKRMFDRAVIDTDKFMDLPVSAKALYFLLGMEADDEGFVSYKKVIRIHGGTEDDMKVLNAKNFLILFKSGVVVITDWHKNNWLDSRRIKKTEYVDEKELLALSKDNTYLLSDRLASVKPEENSIEENSIEENSILAKNKFSQDIPKIIEKFKELSPSLTYGNKTQRKACEEMITKWGIDETLRMVDQVLNAQMTDKFCPRAVTPLQMWQKIGDYKVYFRGKTQESGLPTFNEKI